MPKIKFITSEMSGYYAEFLQSPEFSMLGDKDTDFFKCIKALEKEIQNDGIKNIDEFKGFVFDGLPKRRLSGEQQSEVSARLSEGFNKYHDFYSANIDKIEKHADTMERLQDDSKYGYTKEIDGLYDFFGVDKNLVSKGMLIAVPQKTIDGKANDVGFVNYFSVDRNEPAEEYIKDTTVLRRKQGTPLHETTHFLFANSEMKSKLFSKDGDGAKKLMDTLEKHFENNPSDQHPGTNKVSKNAEWAVDEALAACSTAVVMEKYGVEPGSVDFYSGFEGANKLAAQTYPLYKEYMAEGKSLDDKFFDRLAKRFDAAERIGQMRGNLAENQDVEAKPINHVRSTTVDTMDIYSAKKKKIK